MQNQSYINTAGRRNTESLHQLYRLFFPDSILTQEPLQAVIFPLHNVSTTTITWKCFQVWALTTQEENVFPFLTNQKQKFQTRMMHYHGNLDSYLFSHSRFRSLQFLKTTNLVLNFPYQSKGFKVETHLISSFSYFPLRI